MDEWREGAKIWTLQYVFMCECVFVCMQLVFMHLYIESCVCVCEYIARCCNKYVPIKGVHSSMSFTPSLFYVFLRLLQPESSFSEKP